MPAFAACAISFAVADAPAYVKAAATIALLTEGGAGAFREVADAILLAQGKDAAFSTATGYAKVMANMAQ
ncbi:3-deoxy-D-manno-octulosonate 8-phosphate phosphatase KdsC [compost metagenome]